MSELREEAIAALFEAFDQRDRQARHVWVMSRQWFRDIRGMLSPWGFDPGLTVDAPWTLIGVPVEIREDAGFPKLERVVDVA